MTTAPDPAPDGLDLVRGPAVTGESVLEGHLWALERDWRRLAAELQGQDFGAAAALVRLCADQLIRALREARQG